jgi:hypothetical protein
VHTIVDFTKGDTLAKLFGWIANRRVEKIIANPKLRIEHVQNLNVALSFAKQELQMKNLNLNAEGITFHSLNLNLTIYNSVYGPISSNFYQGSLELVGNGLQEVRIAD